MNSQTLSVGREHVTSAQQVKPQAQTEPDVLLAQAM